MEVTLAPAKKHYLWMYEEASSSSDSDSCGSSGLDSGSTFSLDSTGDDEELKTIDLVTKKEPRPTSAPLHITIKLRREGQTIEALLDSGASKSIIDSSTLSANVHAGRKFITRLAYDLRDHEQVMTSMGTTVVQFKFPKLRADSSITHRFKVIEDSSDAMVIGRDLMNALGLILSFEDMTVNGTIQPQPQQRTQWSGECR